MHQIFHVLALLLFLPTLALAFLGLIRSLLKSTEDPVDIKLPGFKTSLLLAAGAVAGLGGDWLIHQL